MMLHTYMAQQIVADRQRDMLDRANRDGLARAAKAARSARPAVPGRTRSHRLRRVYAALTSH